MSSTSTTFRQKLRARRQSREFERALATATPSMRNELIAIAQHQRYMR